MVVIARRHPETENLLAMTTQIHKYSKNKLPRKYSILNAHLSIVCQRRLILQDFLYK